MNATCILENKNPRCCLDMPTIQPISEGQRPISGRGKKAISKNECSPIHAMVTLLNRTLVSTPGHNTVIRRTWVMAAGSNIAFKIVAKPLQIKTCLLLTSYRKSPLSYLKVGLFHRRPSTTYCLATVHALRTDGRLKQGQ